MSDFGAKVSHKYSLSSSRKSPYPPQKGFSIRPPLFCGIFKTGTQDISHSPLEIPFFSHTPRTCPNFDAYARSLCTVTNICSEMCFKCCIVNYGHHTRMNSSSFIQPTPPHYPDKKTNTYIAWYQSASSVSSHLWHLSWPTKNNCDYMTRTFFTFSHLLCQNVMDSLRCASWVHNILSIVMMRTHCRIRVHADHTKLHLELLISPEVMGCTASTLEGWGVVFVFKNWKFRVGEGRGGGFLHEFPPSVGVWIYSWTTQTKLTFIELA